jgi:hypothetical protein
MEFFQLLGWRPLNTVNHNRYTILERQRSRLF